MIGAITGDVVGSIYEWHNHRSKDFPLFGQGCFATDDTVATLAVGKAILDGGKDAEKISQIITPTLLKVCRPYPDCGFGGRFRGWLYGDIQKPYNSFGNGSAMRISAVGNAAETVEEAVLLSKIVTEVTHNHPEGLKGAEAVAVAMVLAKQGLSKDNIRKYVEEKYYRIDFTIDEIRPYYRFNETCMDTVPQAFEAFFESNGFEDAVRTAISVGGDSDTLAAICGALAEAYYGVPQSIYDKTVSRLDAFMLKLLKEFEAVYPPKIV